MCFRIRVGYLLFVIILPFTFQVYVAAIRNRNLPLPEDPEKLYEIEQDKEAVMEIEFLPHRDIFRFNPKILSKTT